jgi:hypothetical protein
MCMCDLCATLCVFVLGPNTNMELGIMDLFCSLTMTSVSNEQSKIMDLFGWTS